MTTVIKEGLDRPITSTQDLLDYLLAGARPRNEWGVGAESEKVAICCHSGDAAPFSAIETLLSSMQSDGGWEGIYENHHLIGLKGDVSSVTLEPGGQVELSGKLCSDVFCCKRDFDAYCERLLKAARPAGLCLLGLGTQPFSSLEGIGWVPKARYGIMGPYMLRTGDMGQRMMKQTAGLQVNVDFSDEADCLEKMRLAQALSPLFYALFANSPLLDGKASGFLSTRGEIWSRTDPDRTGLIERLFDPDSRLMDYVNYALDVPMYFIVRQGHYLDFTRERFTFRRYLAEGFEDQRPTMEDWDLHLSTLFPEVRLRPQIEVRSADSLPPALVPSVAALVKGLMYDPQSRTEAWALVGGMSSRERHELLRQSWRLGLRARTGAGTLQDLALSLLTLAREGLVRQRRDGGGDETCFLDPVQDLAESGVTLAERLLSAWTGSRAQRIQALVDHCGFQPTVE